MNHFLRFVIQSNFKEFKMSIATNFNVYLINLSDWMRMFYHLISPNFLNRQLNFAISIYNFYTKNQKHTSLSIITIFLLFLKFFADLKSIFCFHSEKAKAH